MSKSHVRPRRAASLLLAAVTGLVLAGCEERISDEIALPRSKPARHYAGPAPRVVAYVPGYAVGPRGSELRSNCAPSRC